MLSLFSWLAPKRDYEVIEQAPVNANWRRVRPKPNQRPLRAHRAEADTEVQGAHGKMRARGGQDYIVTHSPDDRAVVRGEIFGRTYEPLGGGLYRKRPDVVLRYFTLDRPVMVQTLEGLAKAGPGDWIMEGVTGELWPITEESARERYEPAD